MRTITRTISQTLSRTILFIYLLDPILLLLYAINLIYKTMVHEIVCFKFKTETLIYGT